MKIFDCIVADKGMLGTDLTQEDVDRVKDMILASHPGQLGISHPLLLLQLSDKFRVETLHPKYQLNLFTWCKRQTFVIATPLP